MIPYYTTSVKEGDPQPEPYLSIGGYRSGTIVPNDRLDNLFGEISEYTKDKDTAEYIAIMLRNETGVEVTDVKLHFDYDTDAITKYEVAAVVPNTNCEMERVADKNTAPYVGEFFEADGMANQVTISATLADQAKIGIWIRRTLLIDEISDQESCDSIYSRYTEETAALNTEEKVNVVVSYT